MLTPLVLQSIQPEQRNQSFFLLVEETYQGGGSEVTRSWEQVGNVYVGCILWLRRLLLLLDSWLFPTMARLTSPNKSRHSTHVLVAPSDGGNIMGAQVTWIETRRAYPAVLPRLTSALASDPTPWTSTNRSTPTLVTIRYLKPPEK